MLSNQFLSYICCQGWREGGREGGRDILLEDAARRKQAKYQDPIASVQESGYTMTLVTVEVGARGVPNIKAFSKLRSLLGLNDKAAKDLMTKACGQAIKGSYRIWCEEPDRTPIDTSVCVSVSVFVLFVCGTIFIVHCVRLTV